MDVDYALFASVIITVGAFLLAVFALTAVVRLAGLRRRAVRAPGTVVDLCKRTSGSSYPGAPTTSYAPVLAFRTRDGREVRTVSGMASKPLEVEVGQQVRVAYDPSDPTVAYVDTARGSGLVAYAFAVALALLVFVIAGLTLLGRVT